MQGNCKDLFFKILKIFTAFLVEMLFGAEKCLLRSFLIAIHVYFGYSECLAENNMKNSPIFVRLLFYLTDLNNSL